MSKSTTSDMTVADIVQQIEVDSQIALQRSMQDGDPKHHKKMIEKSVAAIEAHYAAIRKADMEYVIGEYELADMVNYNEGLREDDTVVAQNDLRADQRQRMAKRLNNTEEV